MRMLLMVLSLTGVAQADSTVGNPPVAARFATMRLRVEASPRALVEDSQGHAFGETPLRLELPAQPMELRLSWPGYHDLRQTIKPAPTVTLRVLMTQLDDKELRAQLAAAISCDGLDSKPKISGCGHLIAELTAGTATIEPRGDGWSATRPAGFPAVHFRPLRGRWQADLVWPEYQ